MLEFCIRELLNKTALRRMRCCVRSSLIENYPEGQTEEIEAVNHPDDPAPARGASRSPRALYRARRFHGKSAEEVFPALAGYRSLLRYAYSSIKCTDAIKTRPRGRRTALHLTIPQPAAATRRRAQVKATMHWLRPPSVPAEIRIYNPLSQSPTRTPHFAADLNPQSLEILVNARIEPRDRATNSNDVMQFERRLFRARSGLDADRLVFNRHRLADTFANGVGGRVSRGSRRCTRVIASEAKQSILSLGIDGLLRFARNDVP